MGDAWGAALLAALALTLPGRGVSHQVPGLRGTPDTLVRAVEALEERPVLLSHPPLSYPRSLSDAGVRGRVALRFVVDQSGRPETGSIVVVSGVHPVLDSIAVAMIAEARYRPGKMAGRPVRVLVAAPVDFLLGPGVEATAVRGVLTVELVDVKPRRISGPPPRYPPHLRESGIEGVVMLQAILDTVGHAEPGSVSIVSSTNAGFNASAIESVYRSVFRPARLNGIAVRVILQIPVSYTMAR